MNTASGSSAIGYTNTQAGYTNTQAIKDSSSELEQVGRRIDALVARAQANAAQLEMICDRVFGTTLQPVAGKDQPPSHSLLGKLHEVCSYLDANLDSISRSTERLSKL